MKYSYAKMVLSTKYLVIFQIYHKRDRIEYGLAKIKMKLEPPRKARHVNANIHAFDQREALVTSH
jgi:hypothetical protein